MMSPTPGRAGSRYIRDDEMPSWENALRARAKGGSLAVRWATAEAIPKELFPARPSASRCSSPGDSWVAGEPGADHHARRADGLLDHDGRPVGTLGELGERL